MFLVINDNYDNTIEVQGISREMIPNAAGKKEFFIRVIANDQVNEALEYCASFVSQDINSIKLYSKDNDEDSLISTYDNITGRVNSIHEVVENNSQEITVIIDY